MGPLALNCYEGRLYSNSTAVPADARNAETLAEAFEARNIESLTFHPGATMQDALGLVEVLSLRPTPSLDVEEELGARGVTAINVALLSKDDEESAEKDRQRQADRMMYQRALAALRRVQQRLAAGGGDIGETGALVGSVMQRLLNDPPAVLGLATISGSGERDLFHSLNVMIYALALGQRLGLPEEGLQSLGMSALLHDVGKSAFDRGDMMQAEPMRQMHPRVGAEILQRVALEDPAPACPPLSAGQQSGDLLVWLSSTPAQPVAGDAQLDTFVTDRAGEPISGLQITYHADMTNMSHGLYLVATEPAGIGHYAGDVHFSMPGPWRVITIIERPGLQTVRLRFEFRVNSN